MISDSTPSSAEEIFFPSLLNWFKDNARELPWRATKNPYHIWLSEIILQQTRVNQGLPYYLKFLEAYPTIEQLANAPVDEVLRLWQGLGYYSRARNMHGTAKIIVENYEAKFPSTYAELLTLKGIGPYTAAAIASFAFDEAVPVVDGNVYRVLARYFGVEQDIAASNARKVFETLAAKVLIKTKAADCNQAIMEFGALHCKPQNPLCNSCPLAEHCVALKAKAVNELPIKNKKLKRRNRYLYYLLPPFESNKAETMLLYMKRRGNGDVWEGLYEFPLLELESELVETEFLKYLNESFEVEVGTKINFSKSYKHQLTHQQLFIRFLKFPEFSKLMSILYTPSDLEAFKPYTLAELEQLPKPIILDKYLKEDYRSYIGSLFDY